MKNHYPGHKNTTRQFWTLLSLALLLSISPASHAVIILEINKSSQELVVKNGKDVIKRYRIAYGKGGAGTKRRFGDNKTPVGNYKIVDLRGNSRFHFFMQLNYPNTLDAWHGYKNNLIDGHEFKEIAEAVTTNNIPPQDTGLGGYIGLHGIGDVTDEKLDIHDRHNWTEGCIALKNEEISELLQYVTIGTSVLIRE